MNVSDRVDARSGVSSADFLLRTLCFAVILLGGTARATEAQSPAQPWQQYATPAAAGFSHERLEAARHFADSVRSAAVMAAYRGNVVAAWGDVARKLELHSVRKSLVSALYGPAVAARTIDLDASLARLGVQDLTVLTEGEQGARIRDLLAARSGIYLRAAYAPENQDEVRPARGAHPPGTHWFYNNWDFNVAEYLYEAITGRSLYEAFDTVIARPIGMEDYDAGDHFEVYEPGLSRFPAHTFRLSTRDLARFGQLMLQGGRWAGRQIIPEAWVRESTRPHSDLGDGRGYGYMWWTYAAGSLPAYPSLNAYDIYSASGTGGQAIIVIPGAELVVVHRGDTDHGRNVRGGDVWKIADLILSARIGEPQAAPALAAMAPAPLASQLPPSPVPTRRPLAPERVAALLGDYAIAPGQLIRVFAHDGRPFMFVPGRGEAELLALGEDEFTIRVVAGVGIRFERDPHGVVTHVNLALGPDRIRAARVQ